MKFRSTLLVMLAVMFILPRPVHAQVSAGVYGGFTTPTPSSSTAMIMADFGTKFDVEPWVQSYGSLAQVGVDLIVSPTQTKGFGATVGVYSNTRTERVGLTYSRGAGQVRVLRTSTGLWQGIAYYNFNLSPKTYLQVWLAPAQGGSSWLLGVGHTFKE